MLATIFRNVTERSNAVCTTAATFGSAVLMCDIGGAAETGASDARLAVGVARAAATITATTVRFRAVFAMAVSSSLVEAGNGGQNSHRKALDLSNGVARPC